MNISGISFTNREIDVISCIISGRSTKFIGALLDISPRTVSVHIANIVRKIDGGSQEHIINFIEASSFYVFMKRHYVFLLYAAKLKKILLDLAPKTNIQNCYFYKIQSSDFSEKTKTFFETLGANVIEITETKGIEFGQDDIVFLPGPEIQDVSDCKAFKVILTDESSKKRDELQLFFDEDDFFESFLKVIATIQNDEKFSKLASEFSESYRGKLSDKQTVISQKFGKYSWLILALLSICFVAILNIDFSHEQISNVDLIKTFKILERKDLVKRIDKALASNGGIAVLTGDGGSGKTIIARKYMKSSRYKVTWEINSESEENIAKSMLDLAIALGFKGDLKLLQSIPERSVQVSQLLSFISKALRGKDWIILYDNVESLNSISQYFPNRDNRHGKIIVTTRNANTKDAISLESDNIVNVGFLNEREKEDLFDRILGSKISSKNFLGEIPSLPLDICAAAYYMKETGNSSEEYMNLIEKSNFNFYQNQERLLENNLNYSKTRYSIIVSGLKKLLESNEPYKKLAFFLCMVDSQGILKEYFHKISDPFTADRFIYDLKKYSIITEANGKISIHRLSQDISLSYLMRVIPEDEVSKFLDEIIQNFCVYKDLGWFLYESDKRGPGVSDLNDSYIHYVAFLKNIDKLPISESQKEKFKIKIRLAILHASKYIVSSQKIIEQAEEIIADNEKYSVLSNLDLAVVYEIYGRKNIRNNNGLAIKCFKKCLELCKNIEGARCLEAICLADYAESLVSNGEKIDVVKDLLNKAIAILSPADCFWKKQTKVTIFPRYQECLSGYYVSSRQLMDVIFLGNDILREFQADKFFHVKGDYQGDYELSLFMIRSNMAAAFNRMGLRDDAFANLKEAQFFLDKFSEKDASILRHQSTLDLEYGLLLLEQGKLSDAIKTLTRAIKGKETLTNKGDTASGYLLRAEAYILAEKYNEALKDCEKYKSLQPHKDFESNSEKMSKALNSFNLAVIYNKLNSEDCALKHIAEFFKICEEVCKAILNKQSFTEFLENGIFECKKSMPENLIQARSILKAIYGENYILAKKLR